MTGDDTVTLQWPRETTFVDYQTDQRFPGEGVYEIPAKWEAQYRRRGWVDPPEDSEAEAKQPTSASDTNLDGPSRDMLEGASPNGAGDDSNDGGDTPGN